MTFSKYQVPPFLDGNVLPSAVINHSETQIVDAIDGRGGDYTASSPIRVGDYGIQDISGMYYAPTVLTPGVYTHAVTLGHKHKLFVQGIAEGSTLAGSTVDVTIDTDVAFAEREVYINSLPANVTVRIYETGHGLVFQRAYARRRTDLRFRIVYLAEVGAWQVRGDYVSEHDVTAYEPPTRTFDIATEPEVVGTFQKTATPAYFVPNSRNVSIATTIIDTSTVGSGLFNVVLTLGDKGQRYDVTFTKGLGTAIVNFKSCGVGFAVTTANVNALPTFLSVNNSGGVTTTPVTYTFVQTGDSSTPAWVCTAVTRTRALPARRNDVFATVSVANATSADSFYIAVGTASLCVLDTWVVGAAAPGAVCDLRISPTYPHDNIALHIVAFDRVVATATVEGPTVRLIDDGAMTVLSAMVLSPKRHVQVLDTGNYRMGSGGALIARFERTNGQWLPAGFVMT